MTAGIVRWPAIEAQPSRLQAGPSSDHSCCWVCRHAGRARGARPDRHPDVQSDPDLTAVSLAVLGLQDRAAATPKAQSLGCLAMRPRCSQATVRVQERLDLHIVTGTCQ